jgi:hypothetical protein
MRRTLGFLLPILVGGLGCFFTGGRQPDTAAGAPAGDKDRTLEYWGKLRGAMVQQPRSSELRELTNVVRRQVSVVRTQTPDGVDPELLAAAAAFAKSQEKVIELAEVADFQIVGLQSSPQMKQAFGDANRQAVAATARLKALRSRLSARYGVTFPPLDG